MAYQYQNCTYNTYDEFRQGMWSAIIYRCQSGGFVSERMYHLIEQELSGAQLAVDQLVYFDLDHRVIEFLRSINAIFQAGQCVYQQPALKTLHDILSKRYHWEVVPPPTAESNMMHSQPESAPTPSARYNAPQGAPRGPRGSARGGSGRGGGGFGGPPPFQGGVRDNRPANVRRGGRGGGRGGVSSFVAGAARRGGPPSPELNAWQVFAHAPYPGAQVPPQAKAAPPPRSVPSQGAGSTSHPRPVQSSQVGRSGHDNHNCRKMDSRPEPSANPDQQPKNKSKTKKHRHPSQKKSSEKLTGAPETVSRILGSAVKTVDQPDTHAPSPMVPHTRPSVPFQIGDWVPPSSPSNDTRSLDEYNSGSSVRTFGTTAPPSPTTSSVSSIDLSRLPKALQSPSPAPKVAHPTVAKTQDVQTAAAKPIVPVENKMGIQSQVPAAQPSAPVRQSEVAQHVSTPVNEPVSTTAVSPTESTSDKPVVADMQSLEASTSSPALCDDHLVLNSDCGRSDAQVHLEMLKEKVYLAKDARVVTFKGHWSGQSIGDICCTLDKLEEVILDESVELSLLTACRIDRGHVKLTVRCDFERVWFALARNVDPHVTLTALVNLLETNPVDSPEVLIVANALVGNPPHHKDPAQLEWLTELRKQLLVLPANSEYLLAVQAQNFPKRLARCQFARRVQQIFTHRSDRKISSVDHKSSKLCKWERCTDCDKWILGQCRSKKDRDGTCGLCMLYRDDALDFCCEICCLGTRTFESLRNSGRAVFEAGPFDSDDDALVLSRPIPLTREELFNRDHDFDEVFAAGAAAADNISKSRANPEQFLGPVPADRHINECQICLEPAGKLKLSVMACPGLHVFHHDCAKSWLDEKASGKEKMTCPACRHDVGTDPRPFHVVKAVAKKVEPVPVVADLQQGKALTAITSTATPKPVVPEAVEKPSFAEKVVETPVKVPETPPSQGKPVVKLPVPAKSVASNLSSNGKIPPAVPNLSDKQLSPFLAMWGGRKKVSSPVLSVPLAAVSTASMPSSTNKTSSASQVPVAAADVEPIVAEVASSSSVEKPSAPQTSSPPGPEAHADGMQDAQPKAKHAWRRRGKAAKAGVTSVPEPEPVFIQPAAPVVSEAEITKLVSTQRILQKLRDLEDVSAFFFSEPNYHKDLHKATWDLRLL